MSSQEEGVLGAMPYIGLISSSYIWGYLADTRGRRIIMIPTLVMGFVCSVGASLSINATMLTVFQFLTGFFLSAVATSVHAYVGEFYSPEQRTIAITRSNVVYALTCIGVTAVIWLTYYVNWVFPIPMLGITFKPWRSLLVLLALPALFCSIALYFLPESPKFEASRGNDEKALDIISTVYSLNTGKAKSTFPISAITSESSDLVDSCDLSKSVWTQMTSLFSRMYLRSTFLVCAISLLLNTINGIYLWFPDLVNAIQIFKYDTSESMQGMCDVMHAAEYRIQMLTNGTNSDKDICADLFDNSAMLVTVLMEVFFTATCFIINQTISKVGPKGILVIIFGVTGLSSAVSPFVDKNVALYLIVILMLYGTINSVVSAIIVQLYPTNLRATAVGIAGMMGKVGIVIGALYVGQLMDLHCPFVFVLSGGFLLFCIVLSFFIPKEPSKAIADTPSP